MISARTRIQAIHVLDLFAGTHTAALDRSDERCWRYADHVPRPAARLAHHAACATADGGSPDATAASLAEAAGLLRDGWSPGDPIVRRSDRRVFGRAVLDWRDPSSRGDRGFMRDAARARAAARLQP